MENDKTLSDLGVGPNGTVQLEMQSADPVNTPIKAFKPRQEYVMPDVITVRVETGLYLNPNKIITTCRCIPNQRSIVCYVLFCRIVSNQVYTATEYST